MKPNVAIGLNMKLDKTPLVTTTMLFVFNTVWDRTRSAEATVRYS